mgnify:CR=1 FL=1
MPHQSEIETRTREVTAPIAVGAPRRGRSGGSDAPRLVAASAQLGASAVTSAA